MKKNYHMEGNVICNNDRIGIGYYPQLRFKHVPSWIITALHLPYFSHMHVVCATKQNVVDYKLIKCLILYLKMTNGETSTMWKARTSWVPVRTCFYGYCQKNSVVQLDLTAIYNIVTLITELQKVQAYWYWNLWPTWLYACIFIIFSFYPLSLFLSVSLYLSPNPFVHNDELLMPTSMHIFIIWSMSKLYQSSIFIIFDYILYLRRSDIWF